MPPGNDPPCALRTHARALCWPPATPPGTRPLPPLPCPPVQAGNYGNAWYRQQKEFSEFPVGALAACCRSSLCAVSLHRRCTSLHRPAGCCMV